jgi:transposase
MWIAAGVTDMRRGFHGLSAKVQTVLDEQPYSVHVFVFRGRRGDLIKVLWLDGDGLCLFAKRLPPQRRRPVVGDPGWSEAGLSGRKPAKVRSLYLARSCRCCLKASIGGGRRGPGRRRWRCE